MSTETETHEKRQSKRHGFWFGIVAGGLLGALAGGVVAGAATPVLAARAFSHGFGRAGLQDPALVQERAEFAASYILDKVSGTEEQKDEVKRIVAEAIADIAPLADEHRVNRQAIHDEFSRADINPDAIEQIRQAEMALADRASRELTEAFTAFAQTLTVEQRAELMEMAESFHRHRR